MPSPLRRDRIPTVAEVDVLVAGAMCLRPNTYGAGTGVTYDPERRKLVWDDLLAHAGATSRPLAALLAGLLLLATGTGAAAQSPPDAWNVHDPDRPLPPSVQPARQDRPVPPPDDALVLFDGTDLSQWRGEDGGPALWKVENGSMEVVPGSGSLRTRRGFGDVQLHVEWSAPYPARDSSRYRGNSGVYLMDR